MIATPRTETPRRISRSLSWPPLRRCPATLTCTGILTAVYIVEWVVGAFGFDPLPMLALGANSSDLVRAGEWQRLVTGNLLHGGLLHFSLNVAALLYVGGFLELLLGVPRFLALLLISCLGGSVASALLTDGLVAVGVSTGLLGLIGAMMVFSWRFSDNRRKTLKSFAYLVAVTVAISLPLEWLLARLLFIRIDHFGHLGGFVTGVLFVVLTTPERGILELAQARRDPFALAACVALSALFLGTAAQTAATYASQGLSPTAESFLAHVELPEDDDEAEVFKFFYNNSAWILATNPDASRAQLEIAADRMRWAGSGELRETVAERDTLATALYRLGDYDSAIRLERQVLEVSQDPEVIERYQYQDDDIAFFASQLARFEWARTRIDGPLASPGLEVPSVSLVRDRQLGCGDFESGPRAGLLLTKGVWGTASEIHVVLLRDEAPLAFLKAVTGPGAPIRLEYSGLPEDLLACGMRPVVTLAQTVEAQGLGDSVRWELWEMSAEAAELP